jgi:aspartate-semialdehyde dehydrogenase
MKTNTNTTHPQKTDLPLKLNVAVVGATGLVGQEFIKILGQRKFPIENLKLFASQKSLNKKINFEGKGIDLLELTEGCFKGCNVAFFSAGADISLEWAPKAVADGAFVIDNSSAFRMNREIPLVVPEVNPQRISKDLSKPEIIANPNCSTIQLVVALKPLHNSFGLKSVTVATYQSVSGAGREGIEELKAQSFAYLNDENEVKPAVFAHAIAFNNIPHIDKFDDSGFTLEELKVINETKKIMDIPTLDISCTAVRTPTLNGHSEAVWIELEKVASKEEIVAALKAAPGVVVEDDIKRNIYPLTRTASEKDEVFVGRIRRDLNNQKRWLLWIVSDNVRKGAALNGVQIAEALFATRTLVINSKS